MRGADVTQERLFSYVTPEDFVGAVADAAPSVLPEEVTI